MKTRIYLSIIVLCFTTVAFATGPRLLGMTGAGGDNNSGTILAYTCGNTTIDGHISLPQGFGYVGEYGPPGSVVQASNGKIYGMTFTDGPDSVGTLFEYDYATNYYSVKVNFDKARTGGHPAGKLMQALDGKLYGATSDGGGSYGSGTLFSYITGSDSVTVLSDFATVSAGGRKISMVQSANGKLYGMAEFGGAHGSGIIYEYDIATGVLNDIHDLPKYAAPLGGLLEVGRDTLYGMTLRDGLDSGGTVFRYIISGDRYDTLHNFPRGSYPASTLIRATDGRLYGMVSDYDNNIYGNLFSYDISTSTYTDIYDCYNVADGARPFGALLQASDGMLYGFMSNTSAVHGSVIFRFDITTATYTPEVVLDPSTGYWPGFAELIEYSAYLGTGIAPVEESDVKIYSKPNAIVIEHIASLSASIIVTDLLGQQVINTATNDASITLPIEMSNAIYIVQVREGDKETVRKVFVR